MRSRKLKGKKKLITDFNCDYSLAEGGYGSCVSDTGSGVVRIDAAAAGTVSFDTK